MICYSSNEDADIKLPTELKKLTKKNDNTPT